MTEQPSSPFPSVDRVLRHPQSAALLDLYGHVAATEAVRDVIGQHRRRLGEADFAPPSEDGIVVETAMLLERRSTPRLKRMFNLTGTVLHTNLGRAQIAESAIAQAAMAMREPSNLEFDLATGGRGDRDDLIEDLLIELTGSEAATVVNNNAAAVVLVLAALAHERDVIVSRGELIEIGGSFRIPDVMRSANAKLVEVGTTNRTHPRDYEEAIGPETSALMKVHTSNYEISGFVASVSESELAVIAKRHGLPLLVDLGAGSLIDLAALGLPREPIVRDTLAAGADVVTFSGDKLLGGPQAGLIVGKKDLIERIRRHPLKRALRVSKPIIAALEATLLAYRTPDRLTEDVPTLRLLTRSVAEIAAMATRLAPIVAASLGTPWTVEIVELDSQVGSGSLPSATIASVGLAISPIAGKSGQALNDMAERFRRLTIPVIGRIADGRLLLDLRCLENIAGFEGQLGELAGA